MDNSIEARIHINDISTDSPVSYYHSVQDKLESAGIKFNGDVPIGGTLQRFDDPLDFGTSVWRFTKHA